MGLAAHIRAAPLHEAMNWHHAVLVDYSTSEILLRLTLEHTCWSSDPQLDTQKSCSRQGPSHMDEVHVSDVLRRKVEQACVRPLPGLYFEKLESQSHNQVFLWST
jgi:hypothetical protein